MDIKEETPPPLTSFPDLLCARERTHTPSKKEVIAVLHIDDECFLQGAQDLVEVLFSKRKRKEDKVKTKKITKNQIIKFQNKNK